MTDELGDIVTHPVWDTDLIVKLSNGRHARLDDFMKFLYRKHTGTYWNSRDRADVFSVVRDLLDRVNSLQERVDELEM